MRDISLGKIIGLIQGIVESNLKAGGYTDFKITVVQKLPAIGSESTIYLVPSSVTSDSNIYTEYLYISGKWEKVGETSIKLEVDTTLDENSSNPVENKAIVAALNEKATPQDIEDAINDIVFPEEVIISNTQPIGNEWKLWVDEDEESKIYVTAIDENADDMQIPTALAVKVYMDKAIEDIANDYYRKIEIDEKLDEKADKTELEEAIKEHGVFYWDGLSSDENPDNITLWQKIVDKVYESPVLVLCCRNITNAAHYYDLVLLLNRNLIEMKNGAITLTGMVTDAYDQNQANGTQNIFNRGKVVLTLTDDGRTVTKVDSLGGNAFITKNFLSTDVNAANQTDFTPTLPQQPTNKKYVDEEVIKAIESFGIYHWNGLNEEDDPEVLDLWEKIWADAKTRPVVVIADVANADEYTLAMFEITPKMANATYEPDLSVNEEYGHATFYSSVTDIRFPDISDKGLAIEPVQSYFTLAFELETQKIVEVWACTQFNGNSGSLGPHFLPTSGEKVKNYTPTYEYHPATKKYVDDTVVDFITKSVDNLVNYYLKDETYSKEEVNEIISRLTLTDMKVVEELPIENISLTTIYLVPKQIGEQKLSNIYDEYIFISNNWEKIGDTSIDLIGYLTRDDVDNGLSIASTNPVQNRVIKNALDEKADKTALDTVVEDYGIFIWNGKGSDEEPDVLEMFQKIVDMSQNQTVFIIASSDSSASLQYKTLFILGPGTFGADTTSIAVNGHYWDIEKIDTATAGQKITLSYGILTIEMTNLKVNKIYDITYNNSDTNNFLPTDSDKVTNYNPTYDYHPATKKYVDDSIAANPDEVRIGEEGPTDNNWKIFIDESEEGPEYITKTVNDLVNYYKKEETYTQEEINQKISAIPKFSIEVVETLPISNISTTTIYLLKTDDVSNNLYTEYIYVNNIWEKLGAQEVDFTGYATETYVETKLNDYVKTVGLSSVATSGSYNDLNDKPIIPSIEGLASEEWVNEQGFLKELQDIDETEIDKLTKLYSLKLENGIIRNNGLSSGNFKKGTPITIVANEPETGKIFAGWYRGETLIYNTPIVSYTTSDKSLVFTAKYVDESNPVEHQNIVTLDMQQSDNYSLLIWMSSTLLSGYNKSDWGFLFAVDKDNTNLEINDSGVYKIGISGDGQVNNVSNTRITQPLSASYVGHKVVLRPYMHITDANSNTSVVYGDAASLTIVEDIYKKEYLDNLGLTYLWGKIEAKIPTKTSELENNSNFITNTVDNLINYYKKTETYTQEEVNQLISQIPKFSIQPIDVLPTENISNTTVYLLKTSETETGNLYTEYIYVNDNWEELGTQRLDLTGYATEEYVNTELSKKKEVVIGTEEPTGDTWELFVDLDEPEEEYVTKDVTDLTNYYNKDYIDTIVGNIETLLAEV